MLDIQELPKFLIVVFCALIFSSCSTMSCKTESEFSQTSYYIYVKEIDSNKCSATIAVYSSYMKILSDLKVEYSKKIGTEKLLCDENRFSRIVANSSNREDFVKATKADINICVIPEVIIGQEWATNTVTGDSVCRRKNKLYVDAVNEPILLSVERQGVVAKMRVLSKSDNGACVQGVVFIEGKESQRPIYFSRKCMMNKWLCIYDEVVEK